MAAANVAQTGTQGLIFVVDSSDRDRIEEARSELSRIIADREMKDARLLIFANKQDVSSSMRPDEVKNKLQLDKIAKDHKWKIEPSCATTGEGIFEGLVCYLRSITSLGMLQTTNICIGLAL